MKNISSHIIRQNRGCITCIFVNGLFSTLVQQMKIREDNTYIGKYRSSDIESLFKINITCFRLLGSISSIFDFTEVTMQLIIEETWPPF